MTPEQVINKILNAVSIKDVFPDTGQWRSDFNKYVMLIHPDKCNTTGCQEATDKLLLFKSQIETGQTHKDDAGNITYFADRVVINGKIDLLQKSLENYNQLVKLADSHFCKYMPESMTIINNELIINLKDRAIPIVSIPSLPQEHCNWILSRILEFIGWISKEGYSHLGINPESIYVVPETHGIIVLTYYHLVRKQNKIDTISGRYANFYPEMVFRDKKATSQIDIELAKRTICWLAGDKTGSGVQLYGKFNKDWLNFLIKFSTTSAFETYKEYRKIIDKNFTKQFYSLNI